MARHSGLKDPPEVTASAQIQSLAWDYPYPKDVAIKKKKKDANSVDHMPETLGRAEERDGLLSILRQNFF